MEIVPKQSKTDIISPELSPAHANDKDQCNYVLSSPNQITTNWLQILLNKKCHDIVKIEGWDIEEGTDCPGFLSEICFVTVRYKTKNSGIVQEDHLVFKFMPQKVQCLQIVKNAKLHLREAVFYKFSLSDNFQKLAKRMCAVYPVPVVYYAEGSDDSITIVMNNLNYSSLSSRVSVDGSNYLETLSILRSIAVIHSIGILSKDDWNKLELQPIGYSGVLHDLLRCNMPILYEHFTGSEILDTFMKLNSLTKEMMRLFDYDMLFDTVIHGDLWTGQVMFPETGNTACIFDWQFSGIGDPIIDIMCTFMMSTNPEVLENYLSDLLNMYWDTLIKTLSVEEYKLNVTFDSFRRHLEKKWMVGFVALVASTRDFLSGGVMSPERLKHAMCFLDNRGVFTEFLNQHT